MAMRASRPTQEHNSLSGLKTNGSTVRKNKGGLGGRKALNDISNSGKPSAPQASRKHNMNNVIPIGEDLCVSKKAEVGGKSHHVSKPREKGLVGGRKALGDLTNSVKPFNQQQGFKKLGPERKLTTVAESETMPFSIAEECFLHNHECCIKSQKNDLDMDGFLKAIGLDEDVCCTSVSSDPLTTRKSKEENLNLFIEMEEMEEPIIEDWPLQSQKAELLCSGLLSPICESPESPRISCNMKAYDNDFPSFILSETPRRSE